MGFQPNEEIRFAISLSGYSLNICHHVLDVGRAYINEGREAFRKRVEDVFIWRQFLENNWQTVNRYRDVIKANIYYMDTSRKVITTSTKLFYG